MGAVLRRTSVFDLRARYKIKKQVAEKFDVKLRHGALYSLLKSLEEKGFITSQEQKQKGRTRKTYTITQKGKEYIDAYASILKEQIRRRDIAQTDEG